MAVQFAHGSQLWSSADVATTVYTITGLAFQPVALRVYTVALSNSGDQIIETNSQRFRYGIAVSTSSRRVLAVVTADAVVTSACASYAGDDCIMCDITSDAVVHGKLDFTGFTSDGFTFTVDVQTTGSQRVFWEAIGGTSITVAAIVDISEPSATGDASYTVTGFTANATDQIVYFAGVQSDAALNTGLADAAGYCVGAATGASSQWVVGGNSDDGSSPSDTDGWCLSGECLGMIIRAGAATVEARAVFKTFDTNGFTLTWNARAQTGRKYVGLALKGGGWKAGTYTIDGTTLNATTTVTNLPFNPVGLSLCGRLTAAQSSNVATAGSRIALGTGTSPTSRRCQTYNDVDNLATTNTVGGIFYSNVLGFGADAGATVQSAYDIDLFEGNTFRIIVDTAGGVASEFQAYVTMGTELTTQYVGAVAQSHVGSNKMVGLKWL